MTTIAFDYGRKKIGVAISHTSLAEPLCVVRAENRQELINKSLDILNTEKPECFVVGISEDQIAQEAETFGEELSLISKIKVRYVDETLSTFDANQLAIAANIRRKRRHDLEDAFSAAVILQRYLDNQDL